MDKIKLNLKRVTPICIDGRNINDEKLLHYRKVISYMLDNIEFSEIVFIGTRDLEIPGVRFIKIDNMSIGEYSRFCIKELDSHYSSDFCLVFQDDGFITNPSLWNDEFYDYDYIGAPWPLYIGWPTEGMQVGNGGFSLRSKNFTRVSAGLQATNSNEDTYILLTNRETLDKENIKIAPVDVARKFAVEIAMDDAHVISECFGFHAKHLLDDAINHITKKQMKKIDCFPFFNELDLLEMRLEITSPYVDYWVISECKKTFSGIDKPMYLKENLDTRFAKFKDRIFVVEYGYNEGNPWGNEHASRNILGEFVKQNFAPNDIMILSDCDEIPDYRKVDFNVELPAIIETMGYYYYLNCKQTLDFQIVSMFNVELLNEVPTYRLRACAGMQKTVINNAGWHWSFLGGVDKIEEKIKAYAHQDLNIPEFSSKEAIEKRLLGLDDIFGRDNLKYSIVEIDESYPDYIIENQEKLSKYILKK